MTQLQRINKHMKKTGETQVDNISKSLKIKPDVVKYLLRRKYHNLAEYIGSLEYAIENSD